MANLKDLRLRINSVKNTRKITAAMSQIASARLRKAQQAALGARPYGERMQEVLENLIDGIDPAQRPEVHPLLAVRPVRTTLFVAISADRGLCGAFNSNLLRAVSGEIRRERAEGRDVRVISVGNKAISEFGRLDVTRLGKHPAPTHPTLVELSKAVASEVIGAFMTEGPDQIDRAVLYYNHFVSVLTQKVTARQLVPIDPQVAEPRESEPPSGTGPEPVYEPGRQELLAHLIPVAIESEIQQALFNSMAAEIAARRVAMDAATDNASEMIADLTLEYNRERQAAITKELMEIIGGAEALHG